MNRLLLILLILVNFFGCADPYSNNLKTELISTDKANIVGGTIVDYSSNLASSIVFISSEIEYGKMQICTGSFISKSLILTAAHCISSRDSMSVSFRGNDFKKYEKFSTLKISETYKLDFSKQSGTTRNDIGIIRFSGGLPQGATIAELPKSDSKLTTSEVIKFTGIGYGRNTGIETVKSNSNTGEGILRFKHLSTISTDFKNDTFRVDQNKSQGGVCFGDSGGPALIQDPRTKKNILIGMASAIDTNHKIDDCLNESIYINMFFYHPLLKAALDEAIKIKNINQY